MELELIHEILDQFGYIGLFILLWVGVVGAPLPNEIIVVTVGFVSSHQELDGWKAFLAVYLGIVFALTTWYLIGRIVGSPLLNWMKKKRRFKHSLENALRFMHKYHTLSLSFSYFLPGFRTIIPLLYGISKLPFKVFALLAYSSAFVWVIMVFLLGYWFGEEIDTLKHFVDEFLIIAGVFVVVLVFFTWKRKIWRKQQKQMKKGGNQ